MAGPADDRPPARPAPRPAPAASGPTPARVIAGHYGSGKTEFAVNLALLEAARGRRVALVDLDVVNPYFRSRERADLLEAAGVWVISSSLGHTAAIEAPAISPQARAPIGDPAWDAIVDLGGDAPGARVLAQFRADLVRRGYELLVVVNAHRPETADAAGVRRHLTQIEAATGLAASGLVSNTHLLRETTTADVLAGLALCRQVAASAGLPITHVAAIPEALAGLPADALLHGGRPIEAVPIGLHLRAEWM